MWSELRRCLAVVLSVVCCAACSRLDTVAWPASDAAAADCDPDAAPQPALDAPDTPDAGALPPVHWPFALCVCERYVGSAGLIVDAFDGPIAAHVEGHAGGDVGVDADMSLDGSAQVGGALVVAGPLGIALGQRAELRVTDALECGGDLAGASAQATVHGDAAIAGDIGVGALEVGGTFTYPADQALGAGTRVTATATERAPVSVAPPCPCATEERFDTAAAVALRRGDHGNTNAIGDPADAHSLALTCGRHYIDGLDVAGDLALRVAGRSALYVDGDLVAGGALTVALAPGAGLDLFVAGDLRAAGGLRLGDAAGDGRVRLHVGGDGPIEIASPSELHGMLYAPAAELVASAELTVFGALLVRGVRASADVIVHYDERFAAGVSR